MSDDEIRIAVAECCGWTCVRNSTTAIDDYGPKTHVYFFPPGKHLDYHYAVGIGSEGKNALPNYPADLNACAEMEKTLTQGEEIWRYLVFLAKSTRDESGMAQPTFATARQRCEAFLRVKGKWNES